LAACPQHWLFDAGTYMVTAGIYQKRPHLASPDRRDYFVEALFGRAAEFGWILHAWAVLSNHYHFIAASPTDSGTLRRFLGKLHMTTSKHLNKMDGQPGRKVWFQYWDSRISLERSYFARLNYVHNNPVHHGLADKAENYPWCSAAWFGRNAPASFVATVKSSKADRLRVPDDF
jgi:putative transposase